MKYSVLVVDDVESIALALQDYLKRFFHVSAAFNGFEAMKLLKSKKFDLMLTDIRMPGMDGIELIRKTREQFPHTQCVLMTAFNVNDYIQYARTEKIFNIIPKSANLDLSFVGTMIHKILSKNIFGISLYFPAIQTETMDRKALKSFAKEKKELANQFFTVTSENPSETESDADLVQSILQRHGAPTFIRQILEELSSNAWTHNKGSDLERVDMGFGLCDGHVIVSITDFHGSVDKNEVLYRLERQLTPDEKTGLPIGLHDPHGRGLLISRENLDHLIFNIEINKQTEVIGIRALDEGSRERSISIYEIQ